MGFATIEINLVVVVVIVVVVVVFVVVIIVGHKNLTLKFGQNWVNIKGYIVVLVFIVLILLLLLIQKPRFNLVRFRSLMAEIFCCCCFCC